MNALKLEEMNIKTPAELLSVRDLKTYFYTPRGIVKAVNGLSFEVRKGETLGVIGESGCGKTAACLSVMRLIPDPPGRYERGKIYFQGRDILAFQDRELRSYRGGGVSMAFQEPMTALNPVLTVGSQIAEGIMLHTGAGRAASFSRAIEWLERLGFSRPREAARTYPFVLSGGMRQRVMIAIALATNPELFIADEPSSSLDAVTRTQILRLIGDLKKETRLSCILISHEPAAIGGLADRIMVMYSGRSCETGPAEEVLARPLHPYTQKLMKAVTGRNAASAGGGGVPPAQLRLPFIPGSDPAPGAALPGCPFHRRCPLTEEICLKEPPPRYKTENGREVWCRTYHRTHEGTETQYALSLNSNIAISNCHTNVDNNSIIIELLNIKKSFPACPGGFLRKPDGVKAVDGVSLRLRRGETLAVLGESGCGKTTLGRIAVKLLEPSSGALFFEGRNITHARGGEERHFRRKTQMVFQDPFSSLNPKMTVYDIIGEGLVNYRMAANRRKLRDMVVSTAERCGLKADYCGLYPRQFSGGQRQRIAIARALASEPSFIVCDEAVSSLDASSGAQILNLLKDLQNGTDLAYLFMTHDLSAAEFMGGETAVMYRGRIVEKGPAASVFHRPLHPYTSTLLGGAASQKTGINGPEKPQEAFPLPAISKGCSYEFLCPHAGDECRTETPVYLEAEPGRFVSCHRVYSGQR
ncbi:MAG: ABC transporter ATP-binding protein [Treponema sp.]|jgi:peptide/nickel transport system ATP-binding protein|nr:ABC transporter ATP-binding protein [Treponema sp.]